MQLTIEDITVAQDAMAAIDTAKISGKAAYTIIRNLAKTGQLVKHYNTRRDALIRKHSGGKDRLEKDSPEFTAFLAELKVENEVTQEINLHTFTLGENEVVGMNSASLARLVMLGILDLPEIQPCVVSLEEAQAKSLCQA